jgi:hypothetical protein
MSRPHSAYAFPGGHVALGELDVELLPRLDDGVQHFVYRED